MEKLTALIENLSINVGGRVFSSGSFEVVLTSETTPPIPAPRDLRIENRTFENLEISFLPE